MRCSALLTAVKTTQYVDVLENLLMLGYEDKKLKNTSKLRILAIGNSFSQDATAYIEPMAKSIKYEITVRNLFYPGCSLKEHYDFFVKQSKAYDFERNACSIDGEKYSLKDILSSYQWDVITLQQSSVDSGFVETYEPYLTDIIQIIYRYCPHVRLWWHRTWAYDYDSDWSGFSNYNKDRSIMFDMICKASNQVSKKHDLRVIPTGDYIQWVRDDKKFDSKTGIPLYRDGGHLSLLAGRYLAGLTWYRYLLEEDVDKISLMPEGLSEETINRLKRYVKILNF